MSEGSLMWGEQEEYVMVTADYTYQYQKCTYSMHEGEILMLLKRTNNDWWQVIRGGERHAFYAPTQHIQVTAVSTEKMKNILKEERQKLKVNSNSGNDNIALARRSQGHSSELADGRETFPQPEPQPSNNTAASQSYATKKEASRVMVEGKDVHPSRQQQFCSLRNYSLKGAPQRSGTGDMPPSGACQQESSSSTHTSKSSLNDSSVESLRYSHLRKQGMKAGSHDELTSGGRIRSHSTLEVSKHKAASSEELDGRCSGRDLSFRSNQLSPRHRSSSFDFRIFHKELSFSEMKQGSLDKSRKLRISKDLGNRRRSWAVEEIRACENFRPSLTRGEAVDAAIVLDVPPKLPPKQRKHKFETFNSSSESTGKLEDPIDIRLEEILSKSGQLSGGNQLCLNKESDKKHFRHSSDPLLLSENEKKSSITQQEVQESKDPPVALPRKLLLPQASQECLKEDKAGTVSSFSDSMLRDTNGNQIKKSSSHHFIGSNNSAPSTSDGEVFRSGSLVLHGGQKQRGKTHEPTGKESSAPEKTEKKETTPTLPRKAHSTQECPPQSRSPLSKVPGLTFRSFKQKGSRRPFEGKGEEKGRETRETPTLDSSHTGKMMPTPPSPQTSPQRIVFDDWGEYIDDASRRPYYYNSRTREKRWKPPRKGIHSVSIPEIPPSAKMEDSMRGSSIRSPPKSPTPDYPISPRLVHKPFSYTTPPSSSLTKTATQTTSSTTLPHPPAAMSQTLPASSMLSSKAISPSHLSKQKVVPLPLAAPPAVPPSSAKPSYPTTPTTPEFSDVTDDQKNYALLDILYKMPLPKGWEKKYDAFTQRIYFFNTVTRQRPKRASCVSELDMAHLDNKQLIRKSYQSSIEISKDLHLDADVDEESYSDTGGGDSAACRQRHCSKDQDKCQLASPLMPCNVEGSKHPGHEQKVPPQIPPRKSQLSPKLSLSLTQRDSEIVTISSPSRGPGGRSLLSPSGDHPSIVEAGSSVSSFAPRSSFSYSRGHSRSKSESLRTNPSNLLDRNKQEPAFSLAMGIAMMGTPKSQSISSKGAKSPTLYSRSIESELSKSPTATNMHESCSKGDIRAQQSVLARSVTSDSDTTGRNSDKSPKHRNPPVDAASSGEESKLAKLRVCLAGLGESRYEPNWASLDTRPLPPWYDQAKVGIFIHWGVFSVPSFVSEWFWKYWQGNHDDRCVEFMKNNYPPDFTYQDFGPQFTAEFYDPKEWAEVFNASGARYVVLTSKHHEGFTLWPSSYSWGWNSLDVGPKRDLLGDLVYAIRSSTPHLHFGLYHSLFEWFNPLFLKDQANQFLTNEFVSHKTMPELYELVNTYLPEVVWSDGDGLALDSYWNSTGFLAWLFNDSPVKNTVVVNDRWGKGVSCHHGSFYTCADRYNPGVLQPHKWENCMTLDRYSWGYRRNAKATDYLAIHDLLTQLVETISCGGNLLVNVGPTKEGRIPPIMEERLRQMGAWLEINGEAVYESQPWSLQNDSLTPGVWFTSKESTVYAFVLNWPEGDALTLGSVQPTPQTTITMLGYGDSLDSAPLKFGAEEKRLTVIFPSMATVKSQWVWVLAMKGVKPATKAPPPLQAMTEPRGSSP